MEFLKIEFHRKWRQKGIKPKFMAFIIKFFTIKIFTI